MNHDSRTSRRRTVGALLAPAAVLALVACGTSDPPASVDTPEPDEGASVGAIDLAAAGCPATIGIQTDWTPQAEHGYAYQLIGPEYSIDADEKSVTGPLYASGEYTGVDVKIVAGGPAIGFQTAASQLMLDRDLLLAHTSSDDAIAIASDIKLTAVYAQLDKSPSSILWDPATYPEVTDLNELGETGAEIRYFSGLMYMDYLIDAGVFDPAQLDASHDGTASAFVAAEGRIGQHGFAGSEPYLYEYEIEDWAQPVAFDLVHNYGYQPYMSALSILSERLDESRSCLEALVPVLQQSSVDFFADSSDAAAIILEVVQAYDVGVAYSEGLIAYSIDTQRELELVANGPGGYVGAFDEERFEEMFDFVSELLESRGVTVPADLEAADMYTNEFIDTSIGF